ncbi:MAG: hypothetical protein PHX83_14540 [Acidobacteriia bacterium]|nr:hypothetical protein [Terriglobia bacterium]
MFEGQTDGVPVVGAEEWYLGGANVVIGLADENGELIGYFGRNYHPNQRGPVDQIGAEEPAIGRPQIAIGLAIGDDEEVIGWFGSKFLKSVKKSITAPIKAAVTLTTAPMRAAVDIAKGKNVGKTLVRTMVKQPIKQTGSVLKSQLAVAKPVVKVAAPIIKSPVTKAIVGGVAIAFPPVGIPAAAALTAANVALPYVQKGMAAAQAGVRLTAKLAPSAKPAPKPAAKPAPKPVARPAPKPVARPATAVMVRSPASIAAAAAAAKAQADARAKAALALATADKVLSAAKGTMPAQRQAPPAVQAALKVAAKKSVAATYALGKKSGDPDAARGMAVLQIANRLQKIVPAAKAAVPAVVAPVAGQTYSAIHVAKNGTRTLGNWRANASAAANATGTVVLRDGTPIQGNYARVG